MARILLRTVWAKLVKTSLSNTSTVTTTAGVGRSFLTPSHSETHESPRFSCATFDKTLLTVPGCPRHVLNFGEISFLNQLFLKRTGNTVSDFIKGGDNLPEDTLYPLKISRRWYVRNWGCGRISGRCGSSSFLFPSSSRSTASGRRLLASKRL